MVTRNDSLWKTLDWVTIGIYLLLIFCRQRLTALKQGIAPKSYNQCFHGFPCNNC